MVARLTLLFLLGLSLVGCQTTGDSSAEEISERMRFFDGVAGHESSFDAIVDDFAEKDVVFLGETHLDHQTHRLELNLIQKLHEKNLDSNRSTIVSLEMFSRDVQDVVDRYLAGDISESQFLKESNPWGNYDTGYRAIVEWAKEAGVSVIAANVPSAVWRKAAFGGGLESLSEEERATIAKDLMPGTERYWQRYDRTVRGHGHAPAAGSPEDRVEKVQSLWDNTMAESIDLAVRANPRAQVIHVNGGFHSLEKDGTVHQLMLRNPKLSVGTVNIVPSYDLAAVTVNTDRFLADWIVRTEAQARGRHSGTQAILSPRPLRYRIEPAARDSGESASLVWLADSDKDPAKEFDRLKDLYGSEVTVVVVEPIYSSGSGGAWLAKDHRIEDLSTIDFALDRLQEQLFLHYDLDPARCVLAGTGAASEVILTCVAGDKDWPRAMVATKSGPGWFGMEGLSDPPREAHPGPGIHVIGMGDHQDAWQREISARSAVGEPMQWTLCPEDQDQEALLHQMIQALIQ
ncbi:MAG: hypothetical protein CBC13_06950 [Planctomycetia bacterium TMED53]|nr:MAG: hypothetical protein CBC13_06950 [Planctomycetia bacterium TMED53]